MANGEQLVLVQNTGRQAGIISVLEEARGRHGASLQRVRRDPEVWGGLVAKIDAIVRKMPLWKLQTVGNQQLDFLYPNAGRGTSIELYPGVAVAFRAFHDLIVQLIRGAWLRYVRRFNAAALGDAAELGAFMFGSERADLHTYRAALDEVQAGVCFYCHRPLGATCAVDHFVPWSRYPVDLGHNFVLAHSACNGSKSDYLAAEPHLSAWLSRNRRFGTELATRFEQLGVLHNLDS